MTGAAMVVMVESSRSMMSAISTMASTAHAAGGTREGAAATPV